MGMVMNDVLEKLDGMTVKLGCCFHCGALIKYNVENPQPRTMVGYKVYPICARCAEFDKPKRRF